MLGRRGAVVAVFLSVTVGGGALYFWLRGEYGLSQVADAGVLLQQDEMEHVFKVFNPSLRTVHVESMASSCGCTTAPGLPKSVKPLSLLRIPVRVDVREKSGPFESVVRVRFSDSTEAHLSLRGTAYRELPAVVSHGRIVRGAAGNSYVAPVHNPAKRGIIYRDEILNVAVEPQEHEGVDFVRFKVNENAAPGPFKKVLSLFSDPAGKPLAAVEVSGVVRGEVEASSENVSFGYVLPNAERGRPLASLTFSSPYGAPFDLQLEEFIIPACLMARLEPTPQEPWRVQLYLSHLPDKMGLYKESATFQFVVNGAKEKVTVNLWGYFLEHDFDGTEPQRPPT